MITNAVGRTLLAAAVLVASSFPTPVLARDWPTTAGWDIFEGDTYCGMVLEYDGKGDTVLSVGKKLDGDAIVVITNYGWSAKKDEAYDLKFYVGNQSFGGGKSLGTGENYERKGFVTLFGADFFPAFISGASLKIYKDKTLVDSLSLDGSASASSVVDRCLSHVRALRAAEKRERDRFAHIPDDPFATPKSPPTARVAPQKEDSWVSVDDYPPEAIRNAEQGTVTVKVSINLQGRIENCLVTSSSGSPALDRATCASLTRRGRYPAGQPAERTVSHTWKLPEN